MVSTAGQGDRWALLEEALSHGGLENLATSTGEGVLHGVPYQADPVPPRSKGPRGSPGLLADSSAVICMRRATCWRSESG